MADMFSKKKRSQIMAAVKSTGNRVTESSVVAIFRRNSVKGWRRHVPLLGKPDFAFRAQRLLVFVDGCFWHGCQKHLRMPATNRRYWIGKIARNQMRDSATTHKLRKGGWRVLRLWEHELRKESHVLRRVAHALGQTKENF